MKYRIIEIKPNTFIIKGKRAYFWRKIKTAYTKYYSLEDAKIALEVYIETEKSEIKLKNFKSKVVYEI